MQCDALYLHIPFCIRKCPYCDFYSLPATEDAMDAYTGALCRAIKQTPFALAPLDTIYIGGGTPSALGGVRLARILECACGRFGLRTNAEITVECNPCSATPDTLTTLRAAGVNRISMGMQSGSDRLLRRLGRSHDRAGLERAVDHAVKAGLPHFSLDLMLATPGQTQADLTEDIALCARLGAAHVSAYLLKIEPGTPFALDDTASACPDEDTQADLYLSAVAELAKHGYQQYEISNFCKDRLISRHNYKYWDCAPYLGLGPSAHSFVDGKRFYFPRDLARFLQADDCFSLLEQDGAGGGLEEYLMLRLRLREGIVWERLSARFPQSDAAFLHKNARPLVQGGLAVLDQTGLRLTPEGMLVSNAAIAALLG